jgi:hypothetical protein
LKEIEEKQKVAERYSTLAAASEKQFAPMRSELEKVIRQELIAQANNGGRIRQAASFIVWVLTLVLGVALGTYVPNIVTFIKSLLGL